MLMMNEGGTIVLVNAQIEALFGYPRAELLGQRLELLVPERFRAHQPGCREAFFGDPKTRTMGAGRELHGLRKDGTEAPIEIGLNPPPRVTQFNRGHH
jgi:PAS domain S-box-containing protein